MITEREKEVLFFAAKGKTDKEIAKDLFLSRATIKSHIRNILLKLESKNKIQAFYRAIKLNLIEV